MTKTDLINKLHAQNTDGLSKRAIEEIVNGVFDALATTIRKENRVAVSGFGNFTVRQRKARTGRNPKTGESINIPASKTVGFKPAKALKELL
mgnify:CR=1 FL=1